MAPRKRLLVAVAAAAGLVAALITLRSSLQDDGSHPPTSTSETPPPQIARFTQGGVTVLRPEGRPPVPTQLKVVSGRGVLRVGWADSKTAGYDVRWRRAGESEHTLLTVLPEVQLTGLTDGSSYTVEVRAVDTSGQRSAATTATGTPVDRPDTAWKAALTGLYDDFTDGASVRADVPGSRWHVSGYSGCVNVGTDRGHLTISLACGTDQAVLRARSPMRLHDATGTDAELGRIAVVTDTAGPGGRLTVGLVPGPADRISTEEAGLPAGAVQVVVDDQGAHVQAAADVPRVATHAQPEPVARRGVGVPHRFEVVITTAGIEVRQDGVLIGVGGVLPSWHEASVLLGFSGPNGRRSRIHVDAAGFSGPSVDVPKVLESPVVPGTHRVLAPDDAAPNIGTSRRPLISAASARVVATVLAGGPLDPANLVVQLRDRRFPARPAVPGPAVPGGSSVTVIADLPADLFGADGPEPLSPFVLRTSQGTSDATVVESYLEISPTTSTAPSAHDTPAPQPLGNALPSVAVHLNDAAGKPVDLHAVPVDSRIVIAVTLDGAPEQWDSGALAGVQGFQLWLDGKLEVGEPTNVDGPGVGGQYTLLVDSTVLTRGQHVLEIREYGTASAPSPVSMLTDFTVS